MTSSGNGDATVDAEAELSPVKRALVEIRQLRATIAAMEAADHEPIAIVGIGLRLPGGVSDLESLWRVLGDGVDTISEVPADRWDVDELYDPDPDRPGTMWTRAGGFLEHVDRFDAAFFGISPREAASMDPQQRLVLEVGWEALEDGGLAPDQLSGTATGVFMGVGNTDYFRRLFSQNDHIDAYAGSGGSAAAVAGRLSYQLGLRGPSLTIDTACSASLVAVHLAARSLRLGECDVALAGGVNLMLGPEAHIAFTKARMMAPDGRCKTFDAAADGYGRGEGAAMVTLRRLGDAVERGDRILAVVRGSAVNQDGRSAGMTAPNGPSQVDVIREALGDAGLEAGDVDYVEAHGTGTSLGDPIELQAIAEALGAGRAPDAPVLVGSCKTNFGHLEAAAGIAGLAKLVAALHHGELPPHLHFETPNPLVDWDALPIEVTTSRRSWPEHDRPSRGGVSSFGFTGTNAHVILEQAPPTAAATAADPATDAATDGATDAATDRPRHVLALSAATDAALRDLAVRYLDRLDDESADAGAVADLCWSANTGRAHLARRLAVTGADGGELRRGLVAYVAGEMAPNLRAGGAVDGVRPTVGMLFTGQGAQHTGMARTLYETSPSFRTLLDERAAVLDAVLDRPLLSVLYPAGDGDATNAQHGDGTIGATAFAQPALFAVEHALATLWMRWGVEPAVLLGHSVGELVAACVAGVVEPADALRLVAARGRLMQSVPDGGAMAMLAAAPDDVERLLAEHGLDLEVAAYNAPAQVVLSGPEATVEAACAAAEAAGLRATRLVVSHAFHSRDMDGILEPFEREVAGVPLAAPRRTLVSNSTGRVAEADEITRPAYWSQHIRRPVRFDESMRTAVELGVTHFVEVGPAPVLLGMASSHLALGPDAWLPSLRRQSDDWDVVLETLQTLYVAGVDVDWAAFDADYARRRVPVPTYPFQRRRYWLDLPPVRSADDQAHVWRSLTGALDRQAGLGPIGVDLRDYDRRWATLERLTTVSAGEVLRGAGVFAAAGDRAGVESVRRRLGAADDYDHLLRRWLDRLAAAGELRVDGDEYVADAGLAPRSVADALHEADEALADDRPLYDYVANCSRLLPAVIGGTESPLSTLFPGGSSTLAEGMYERSATARYINGLAATALQTVVAARGARHLRVLEVGAGTGGTTSALLRVVDPERTDYWFTDVSDFFLDAARRKFADFPFVRYELFDLEQEPAAQGIPTGAFDVVLAANAVHATSDLRQSIDRLRGLLAPGGVVMLAEASRHLAWFDMTTGLIEGWQAFDDDLRTDNPLLEPSVWVGAFLAGGLAEARAWPAEGSVAAELAQHLIVGQATGGASAGRTDAGDELDGLPAADDLAASGAAGAPVVATMPARQVTEWQERFAAAFDSERDDVLRDLVRERTMRILRLDDDQAPGSHDRLMDLGFDSLMAVQLSGQLGEVLGLSEVPSTLIFDHPTIAAVAEYLLGRLDEADRGAAEAGGDDAEDRPGDAATAESSTSTSTPTSTPTSTTIGATASSDERAAEVAAMSDAEIEALLLGRLGDT